MIRARRLQRRFGILATVIQEPGLTPQRLASASRISERTLYRDLRALRMLGYGISYSDGYQLQESLALDGAAAARSLAHAYEQQLQVLRDELPAALADQVESDINTLAPAVLAALFATVIEKRLNNRR